ncbi:MAG: hypothetical protein H0W64_12170 [Gammaproteobacteria bacterium]|nr:hypothetical protein [Gammaproteobacteria bacterium]
MVKKTCAGVALSLLLSTAAAAAAINFDVSCKEQEYVLMGTKGDYYLIHGLANLTWKNQKRELVAQGRFLNQGYHGSLKLKTVGMRIETFADQQGVNFYCDLQDSTQKRVAFVSSKLHVNDFGLKGTISGCKAGYDFVTCTINTA